MRRTVSAKGIVLCLSGRKRRPKNPNRGRYIRRGALPSSALIHLLSLTAQQEPNKRATHQTVQPPKQIKSNLIPQKRVRGAHRRHPRRPRREDEALPKDVGDAAPQQEEAAEGEGVGRDDPLQAGGGNVEVAGDDGEEDYR